MRFFFALLLFVCTMSVFAQGTVTKINNSHQILVKVTKDSFKEEQRVMIISGKENKVVAFGEVHDFHLDDFNLVAKITILEVVNHSLIVPGDEVVPLDYRIFVARDIPGFNSITLKGSRSIPAQYKELAYMGVFSADGHTLDDNEMLISPFQIQYGVTNSFGVKIVNALFLDGYLNAGVKYQFVHNQFAKFTLNAFGAYKTQKQDWIGQFGGILTIPSNAKFETHWVANFTFDRQFQEANATKGLGLFQDSEIRSITEYITDSWNRVLFGPTFNVELQSFGGTLSYMWIWDTFHMNVGMGTKNFADLEFNTSAYYYVYDFFWRF